jgi:hypothetical protein
MRDLLKTIQIQLCLKQQELNLLTLKRLLSIHHTVPILNTHFLRVLLQQYNKLRELRAI